MALTEAEVQSVKDIFWQYADFHPGGKGEFQKIEPKWCAAIEAMPNLDKISALNIIECEVTLDVIKRAKGLESPLKQQL